MTRKGYKLSVEHKKKLSDAKKGNKNPNFGKLSWNSGTKGLMPIPRYKGMKTGKPAWNRGRPHMQKENNPNWRGGISCLPYCKKMDKGIKRSSKRTRWTYLSIMWNKTRRINWTI